jgi:hypothetical protein
MYKTHWRLEVVRDLTGPNTPRILDTQTIGALLNKYRPRAARSTIKSLVWDLINTGVVRPIPAGLFVNLHCIPPVALAEAASHLRVGAVVSMQSALSVKGIIDQDNNKVTSVVPSIDLQRAELEILFEGDTTFYFHSLPEKWFSQSLGADILDPETLYPSFVPEKALLDWLYVERFHSKNLPNVAMIKLERLNFVKLFGIAERMALKHLIGRLTDEI